jgi:outer membrane protein assembly factor BamB
VNGTRREILAVGNPNGKLEFLDVENGNRVDELMLGSKELFGDVSTTPVLHDKILYAASFNNSLVALDSDSRVRKWELKEKGITQLASGNGIIVAAGAKFVLGVNAKTGKELWRFSFDKGAATAIHIKGREVIVGSDIDGLYVLDLMTGRPAQVLGSGLGFSGSVHEFENDLLAMSSAGALFFFNRTDQVVSGRKLALERYESGR